jgi:hypothetical protein
MWYCVDNLFLYSIFLNKNALQNKQPSWLGISQVLFEQESAHLAGNKNAADVHDNLAK